MKADSFTRDGARALMKTIKNYWLMRGYMPKVWIEPFVLNGVMLWQVRSNMENGRPLARDRIVMRDA